MKKLVNMRMMGWLQIALALTIITFLFNPGQVAVSLYKFSLIAIAGCGGYWLDRSIFPYARPDRFYPADDDPDIEGEALNFSIDTQIQNDLLFAVAQNTSCGDRCWLYGRRSDRCLMRRSSLLRCFALACLCSMSAMAAAQQITPTAMAYRAPLIRVAHAEWGLGAPVATFAAQIQQESGWNPNAVSKVGAQGMAQFMPATAKWWCEKMKLQLVDCMPTNPTWAMRSLVQYDLWLYNQIRAADHCQRMAMTLSAYNGGLGWVFKDKKLCIQYGAESANMVRTGGTSKRW